MIRLHPKILANIVLFKEFMAGLCYTWFWGVGLGFIYLFDFLAARFGVVIIFIGIGVICIVIINFTVICVPETRQTKMKQAMDTKTISRVHDSQRQISCKVELQSETVERSDCDKNTSV